MTFGESNVSLIASATHAECVQFVKFICVCVRNPEKQIVELTYDFWYLLQTQINANYPESRELFKPIFSEMATILISHVRYPVMDHVPLIHPQVNSPTMTTTTKITTMTNGGSSGSDSGGGDSGVDGGIFTPTSQLMDSEDWEEFLRFRNETADVLTTVYELLFSDYFALCMNGIKQGFLRYHHDVKRWQLIESSLFAILSVSDCVKHEQLSHLIPIVQMYGQMPTEIVEIRLVQVQILSQYANWVCKQSHEFIVHAIHFTLQTIFHFSRYLSLNNSGNNGGNGGNSNSGNSGNGHSFLSIAAKSFGVLCMKVASTTTTTTTMTTTTTITSAIAKTNTTNTASTIANTNHTTTNDCDESNNSVSIVNLSNFALASNLVQSCMSNMDQISNVEIQIELYKSLSHVLFAVNDLETQLRLMHYVLQGVIHRIKTYHDHVSENHIGQLIVELRKLQASMEACNGAKGSRTLLTVIQQIWSLLCETMIGYKMSMNVIAQFCKLFNCMVCSVGVFPETLDFMNNITCLLYKMYYEIPYPSLLSTINVITCKYWEDLFVYFVVVEQCFLKNI